jgi:hypothetical protein
LGLSWEFVGDFGSADDEWMALRLVDPGVLAFDPMDGSGGPKVGGEGR